MFFPGASKGDDEHRRIYDPISTMNDYHQLIRKNKLDSFGRCGALYMEVPLYMYMGVVQLWELLNL